MSIAPIGPVAGGYGRGFDAAVAGLQRSERAVAGAAHTIATQGPDPDALMALMVQPQLYAASAIVLRNLQETSGTLIDVLA